MAHDRTTPECDERFKAIGAKVAALTTLAQSTQATVLGNGKPGLVTAQALVAQKLGDLESRLADVEGKIDKMAAAPREVREEMVAGFGRVEGMIERLAPPTVAAITPAPQPSLVELISPAFKVALAAIGLVGTVLAILAAVLGVQIGGSP